jgi:hypothetical protein
MALRQTTLAVKKPKPWFAEVFYGVYILMNVRISHCPA